MKFCSLILIALSASLLAAAWHVQMYSDKDYKNVIEDRKGTLGQGCKNISPGNAASSLHWYPSNLGHELAIWDKTGCEGGLLLDLDTETHLSNFKTVQDSARVSINDRAKSYQIFT